MARVHRYGLAAVAELQSFMAAQDPDLGPTAAQYLRFLRAVFDGKDTSPEFDPAFDFGEQARIARRESEPPEVRREALARVVSQAACAIRSLRVVAASEDDELAGAVRPELDRIRELFESRPNGRTVR